MCPYIPLYKHQHFDVWLSQLVPVLSVPCPIVSLLLVMDFCGHRCVASVLFFGRKALGLWLVLYFSLFLLEIFSFILFWSLSVLAVALPLRCLEGPGGVMSPVSDITPGVCSCGCLHCFKTVTSITASCALSTLVESCWEFLKDFSETNQPKSLRNKVGTATVECQNQQVLNWSPQKSPSMGALTFWIDFFALLYSELQLRGQNKVFSHLKSSIGHERSWCKTLLIGGSFSNSQENYLAKRQSFLPRDTGRTMPSVFCSWSLLCPEVLEPFAMPIAIQGLPLDS